jgi:hypothetical protein
MQTGEHESFTHKKRLCCYPHVFLGLCSLGARARMNAHTNACASKWIRRAVVHMAGWQPTPMGRGSKIGNARRARGRCCQPRSSRGCRQARSEARGGCVLPQEVDIANGDIALLAEKSPLLPATPEPLAALTGSPRRCLASGGDSEPRKTATIVLMINKLSRLGPVASTSNGPGFGPLAIVASVRSIIQHRGAACFR